MHLESCDLTVEASVRQELTQRLHAMHLCLGPASAVIAAPSSPDGPPDARRRAQDFVPDDWPGGVGFPRSSVLAGRDDCSGATGRKGVMALASVEDAVGGDGCDLRLGQDPVK